MRIFATLRTTLVFLSALFLPALTTLATDKASSGTELTDSSSWAGGIAPGTADTARWIASSNVGSQTVANPVEWQKVDYSNNGNISLTGSAITLSGATLNNSFNIFEGSGTGTFHIANDLILSGTVRNTALPTGAYQAAAGRLAIAPNANANLVLQNVTVTGGPLANDANLMLFGSGTINGKLTVDGQVGRGGPGVWTLNGANDMGWVYINNGTLRGGNDQAFGAGTFFIGGGGGNATVASANGTTRTFANQIDFTGGDAGSPYTSTVSFGESAGGTGKLFFTGDIALGTAERKIATVQNTTFSGVISGTGGVLNKSGNATLFLTGDVANTYSGGTIINAGILSVGTGGTGPDTAHTGVLGTGTVTINGSTLRLWIQNSRSFTISNNMTIQGGTLLNEDGIHTVSGNISVGSGGATFSSNWSGKTLTLAGQISGSGRITILNGPSYSSAQIYFTQANTMNGIVDLLSGTLYVGHDNALGTATIRMGGGTIAAADMTTRTIHTGKQVDFAGSSSFGTASTGNLTFVDNVNLGSSYDKIATINNSLTTFSGILLGSGGDARVFTKAGAGEMVLSGDNTYARKTLIQAGKLTVGHINAFGTGTYSVTVTGGTLDLGSYDVSKPSIEVNGGKITGLAYTGTVNIGSDASVTGIFQGTVNSGTDIFRNIDASGGLIVGTLSGQGYFGGADIHVTTLHDPGNSIGGQTFQDGLAYEAGAVLKIEITPDGAAFDQVSVENGFTIANNVTLQLALFGTPNYGDPYWDNDRQFTFLTATGGMTGDFNSTDVSGLGDTTGRGVWSLDKGSDSYTAVWTAVPEPATALLGVLGFFLLLKRRNDT